MSIDHKDLIYLGDGVVPGLYSCGSLDEVPDYARVVVVSAETVNGGVAADRLRRRAPQARLIVAVTPEEAHKIPSLLDLGFDDCVCGDNHLQRRVKHTIFELDLLDGFKERQLAHSALTDFVGEIAAKPQLHDVLRTAVLGMRELFEIDRVSVVILRPGEEFGHVVMEQDKELSNVAIQVADYPELMELMRTREPLVISDVLHHSLLSGVRERLEEADVAHRSAVLFPLILKGEVVGALFLRGEQTMAVVEDRLLGMGRLIASVTSVAIGHALEQNVLKTEQKILRRTQADKEEQIESLQEFSDFFEKANDGFVVTDKTGVIRYVNVSGAGVLCRDRTTIQGTSFGRLIVGDSRTLFQKSLDGHKVGDTQGYVDLTVVDQEGNEIVLSATIRHLYERDTVLIGFRDVTHMRRLEAELRNTKEFLENLIQSSVDAIVAADMKGRIILFNRSAERMLQYSALDVVGKRPVSALYEEGVAPDVMRKLRSVHFGGRGRLEVTRQNIVAKDGTEIPVNLTAAVIYESGEEVATVGIFTDLRDRLKIEEKLEQAEEELRESERKAIAIELAGAAAHELNQPLTSIMGYADLLKMRIQGDEQVMKPLNTIYKETERMARIVRKLGQITRYSTRPYVGDATILDLSRQTVRESTPDKDDSSS